MSEIWKPIPGFERFYEASDKGNVRSLTRSVIHTWMGRTKTTTKTGRVLRPYIDKDGYAQLRIFGKDGAKKKIGGHQAVALAFIPNPHGLPQVAHKDHNRTNNMPDNLKWATNAENHQDSVAIHRYASAGPIRNKTNAVTIEIVRSIRARYAAGERPTDIARDLGLNPRHVTKIVNRERWAHA